MVANYLLLLRGWQATQQTTAARAALFWVDEDLATRPTDYRVLLIHRGERVAIGYLAYAVLGS